jgi:hypothetical protein
MIKQGHGEPVLIITNGINGLNSFIQSRPKNIKDRYELMLIEQLSDLKGFSPLTKVFVFGKNNDQAIVEYAEKNFDSILQI